MPGMTNHTAGSSRHLLREPHRPIRLLTNGGKEEIHYHDVGRPNLSRSVIPSLRRSSTPAHWRSGRKWWSWPMVWLSAAFNPIVTCSSPFYQCGKPTSCRLPCASCPWTSSYNIPGTNSVPQMPQPRKRATIYRHMMERGTQVGPRGKVSGDVGFCRQSTIWWLALPTNWRRSRGPCYPPSRVSSTRSLEPRPHRKNSGRRNLWKLMANSFWGTFSQTMKTIP